MAGSRIAHIVLVVAAVFAAAVLFVTYGTVLLAAPFAEVQLNGPSLVDSDGECTAVADTESRRVLILNSEDDLTGVVSCATMDSPIEAVTNVCVSQGVVYVSGVLYAADSDNIAKERVAAYDKGGNLLGVVYETEGYGTSLAKIKGLDDAVQGCAVVAVEVDLDLDGDLEGSEEAGSGGSADGADGAESAESAESADGADGSAATDAGVGDEADDEADAANDTAIGDEAEAASTDGATAASDAAAGDDADAATPDAVSDMANEAEAEVTSAAETDDQGVPQELVVTLVGLDDGATRELERHELDTLTVHDVAYSSEGRGLYASLSVRGLLDDGADGISTNLYADRVFTAIDVDDAGMLYACDDLSGALCRISVASDELEELVGGQGYDCVSVNNGVLSACSARAGLVRLGPLDGSLRSEFGSVGPSLGFAARMTLVWISALYLVVLAVVLAARKLVSLVKSGKTGGLGPMLLAVSVSAATAVAVGALSVNAYNTAMEERANVINMCGDYLLGDSADMSEAMERIRDRDALRGDGDELDAAFVNLFEVSAPALSLADSATRNNIGLYATLYGKDERGVYYLYGSSYEYVVGTSVRGTNIDELEALFDADFQNYDKLLSGSTLRDTTQYRLVPIPASDLEGVVGVMEIGSRMRSFDASVTGRQAQGVLAILVVLLVVYLAYSELRACGHCVFEHSRRQSDSTRDAVAMLTRPFTLAITMLSSIDSVMTVLIARDLLARAGLGDTSPLLGVPAIMLGVGLVIGQGLYGYCGSRVGLRKLMAAGALFMFCAALFTGVAVLSENFWLYCVAKLVMASPFGLLYSLGYSLPRIAESDEVRAQAAGGVKRTDTSAAALGTVLGGYAAQVFGNAWIYALVALACIPVFIMATNLLPRGIRPLEELAQPDRGRGAISSFLKTSTAVGLALFVVLPATVAAGYASFLFPLFSADLGLTKSDINNIVVLGQLVVYIGIGGIDAAEARFGKWRVSTVAIALIGVVFLLFAVNTTLLWSVAVVALVALLCKSSDGWKAMWLKSAGEVGVPAGSATGAMFATRSLALVAQPFILSALLGATDSVAVIVIGVICALCAAAFFAVTRRTTLPTGV